MALPNALPKAAHYEMVFCGLFEFQKRTHCPSRCYLRLYEPAQTEPGALCSEPDQPPVAIATYWMDKPGTSITNAVEILAEEAWRMLNCPSDMVWLENYEPEPWRRKYGRVPTKNEFDRVSFLSSPWDGSGSAFGGPQWQGMARADVERLLGLPVLTVNP